MIEQAEGTSSQQDDSHRANKKLKVVHAEQEASSPAIVSSSSTDCQSEKLQLGELAVKQTPETEGATHPAKPTKLTGWRAVAARQALEGSGTCRTSDFAQFELVLAFLKEQKEEALRELYSTGRGDYDLIKKRMDAEAKMFLEDQAQRTEKAQQLWARADWERMRAEGKQVRVLAQFEDRDRSRHFRTSSTTVPHGCLTRLRARGRYSGRSRACACTSKVVC